MRLLIIPLIAVLLIAGCTTTQSTQKPVVPPVQQPAPQQNCHTVYDQVPKTELKCGDVQYTESVCGVRKLVYTVNLLPRVDLCIGDDNCTGKPLGECPTCIKGMTRCQMVIHNDEPVYSGNWVVAANYTLQRSGFQYAGFIKDPINLSIAPNSSATFDFNQIYDTGSPPTSATCVLNVTSDPSRLDCHDETKTKNVCNNVTTTEQVPRQVCD